MKYIIGLVGSGKTTLYRKLNEEKQCNAVELELPQSCIGDDVFITKLFELYLNNPNIDCIIVHPFYLPKHFYRYLTKDDTVEFLDVPLQERMKRILIRSNEIDSKCQIFDAEFLHLEEQAFRKMKEEVLTNG